MRLLQLIFLKHLLPRPVRRRFSGSWNKLLQWEHLRHTASPEKSERWNKLLQWENFRQETRFYKQFIKRGDLVFDVGANVGVKTAAFLSAGARVVAVEPNPFCVDEIRKMNRRALARGRLNIEAVAVSDSRRTVTLTVFEGNSSVTTGSPDFVERVESYSPVATRLITVPGITLDDLIERHGLPDFLKIDVEGMDAEVLKGLHRKPKFLSFEYHMNPPLWENAQGCLIEVERLGFTAANVTDQSSRLLFGDWLEIKSVASELRRLFGDSKRYGDVVVK
jgi:FkbM family methyltransferase